MAQRLAGQHVLMTGVTGFVGEALLHRLARWVERVSDDGKRLKPREVVAEFAKHLPYGHVVAPGIAAPHHQHFFNFRLDFDVDGSANSVVEMNTFTMPPGENNPFGNAMTMSESDRQTMTLNKMNSLFNNLSGKFETGTSQIWQDDEWARGAFTYFQPGQMTGLLPIAQRPEGRIHFAGEHTSAWHGWMNGALESGNRAAEEINAAESAQAIFVSPAAQSRSA